MINMKDELAVAIETAGKTIADISYGVIQYQTYSWERDSIKLSFVFEPDTLFTELPEDMDFEYDNGFGGQQLFGFIVFNDNTWLSRGEYDGSEWWEYNSCPTWEMLSKYMKD